MTRISASFTLLAVTFGLPVALYVFGHTMIPTTLVKPSVMWAALQKPDDGHIFLQGIYLAAWVGWFLFFFSVFLEIVALVQHRAALRLPGLAWLQRGVGTLVTAAVVIVAAPVAAMAATPGSAIHSGGGTVATAPSFAHSDQFGARQSSYAQDFVPGPTYVVRSGDSLWKIAQEQLGDPNRFADIARLNDGRQMPDGSVFHYSEFLRSGWVLLMPNDTSARTSTPTASGSGVGGGVGTSADRSIDSLQIPAPPSGVATYTVRTGDSLSSIAQAQLGNADRWTELFELNKGRPQAGGPPISSPDLIWPGDVLVLPAVSADSVAPLPPSAFTPQSPPPAQQVQPIHRPEPDSPDLAAPTSDAPAPPPVQAPVNVAPVTSAPPVTQGPVAPPSAAAQAPKAVTPPVRAAAPQEITFSTSHTDSGKTVGTVGGLLAAGLLTVLGTRRLTRLRRRLPGQRISLSPPDDWELEMRTVENPTGRVFIDAALRTLAAKLAEADRILPDLTAVVLKPHGLELHLSRMEPPVSPFYADPARLGVWICPLGAPLEPDDGPEASQAPYPALVSLGFDEGDDSVLIDLEATKGVSLLAPSDESVAVLRALAIELVTGAWSDQLAVTLVGFGSELPELFAPGCLSYTDALESAVDDLARWSASVEETLDRRDVSLREARTYPDPELVAVSSTHLLLSAVPLDGKSAYRLRQIMSGQQRTSVAVVALVREPDHLLSPWVVTGPSFKTPPSQVGGPGLHIRMQALRTDQYSAIIRDLSGADLDDEWASAQRDGFTTPHAGPTIEKSPRPIPRTSVHHLLPVPPVPDVNQPSPVSRFRIPIDDLFRIESLPPAADPKAIGISIVPMPGSADAARHSLNPANLPQFDLVLTPWHGDSDTEQILAVPNAAPLVEPKPDANPKPLSLTTFAAAGSLAGDTATTRGELAGKPSAERRTHQRPGQWQSAYWDQRRAAKADQQNQEVDPMSLSRSIDILGPIDLSGTPGIAGSRGADLAEVAAFIMIHPGCSAAQIAAELWPGRSGAGAIRDAQIARLREFLGTDAYGVDHLQTAPDGYQLGQSVTCDWLEFTERVKSGGLVSAISLIRGRPFQDAPLRRYGWAETLRHEMTALIIDTAHYVAEACLREQNPRGAQNAAYRGLQAAPESELLYRDLLTALSKLGDITAARHHADTLIAYADREGIDLQPETTTLLRDVLQAVPGV